MNNETSFVSDPLGESGKIALDKCRKILEGLTIDEVTEILWQLKKEVTKYSAASFLS